MAMVAAALGVLGLGVMVKQHYQPDELWKIMNKAVAGGTNGSSQPSDGAPEFPVYKNALNTQAVFNVIGRRNRRVTWWDDALNPDARFINGNWWTDADTDSYLANRARSLQCYRNPLINNGLKHNRDAPNPVYQWVAW